MKNLPFPTGSPWRVPASLAFAIVILFGRAVLAFDGSGSGTAEDPYLIETAQQLQQMQQDLTAHYALAGDVDATETATWNGGLGFAPVGSTSQPFNGHLDGRDHRIHGLRINRFGYVTTYIAVFAAVGPAGTVENLTFTEAFSQGADQVAILAGRNEGVITRCHADGQVYGSGTFGGLVAANTASGVMSICSADVEVRRVWVGNHLGGLVGRNDGLLQDCYATGNVDGNENPGGLAGINSGSIINSYATGNVSTSWFSSSDSYPRGTGGLVGEFQGGRITGCFATGQVSGQAGWVGSLVGYVKGGGVLEDCYSLASPGVGRVFPDAGPIDWTVVPLINETLFQPASAPLGFWDFSSIWAIVPNPGGLSFPFFNRPPTVLAQDVTVSTDPDQPHAMVTPLQVDYGSHDPEGDPLTFSLNPPGPYPIGVTPVLLTVADPYHQVTAAARITVRDEQAPYFVSTPASLVVPTDPGRPDAVVHWSAPVAGDNSGSVTVACLPASGSAFPVGTTEVTCTARDGSGNTATSSFTVTVQDREAPRVTCTVTTTVLWPANHQMVDVGLTLAASDNVGVTSLNLEVTHNEGVGHRGKGQSGPDAQILRDAAGRITGLLLRAERSPSGTGRVYLVTATARDAAGNTSVGQCTVEVPVSAKTRK